MSAKEQKEKKNSEEVKEDTSPESPEKSTPEEKSDYDFIREKIRERPVNKKKLVKRSLFTSGMAVLFGVIACLTFLLMEPLLSKWITSDQEIKLEPVELNENVEEEEYPVEAVRPLDDPEVSPGTEPSDPDASSGPAQIEVEKPIEEMSLSDDDVENSNGDSSATAGTTPATENSASSTPADREVELEDYMQLYRKMYSMSGEVSKSLVVLTADQGIDDWLNEEELRGRRTTGVIIGENGYELLILADSSRIKTASADGLTMMFSSGDSTRDVYMRRKDHETGLAIYAVKLNAIPEGAKDSYTIATIGNSSARSITGNAVIAAGMPLGNSSVCYGSVTSAQTRINETDAAYHLLTTDIYASVDASGILTNVRGQVVGIICSDHHESGMENLIYAYGISSIKQLIEDLSNSQERVYLGNHLAEVPADVMQAYNVPEGVYITDVDMDSPAMKAGLNRGDVIVKIGDMSVKTVDEYMAALHSCDSGENVTVEYARTNGVQYVNMSVEVEPAVFDDTAD